MQKKLFIFVALCAAICNVHGASSNEIAHALVVVAQSKMEQFTRKEAVDDMAAGTNQSSSELRSAGRIPLGSHPGRAASQAARASGLGSEEALCRKSQEKMATVFFGGKNVRYNSEKVRPVHKADRSVEFFECLECGRPSISLPGLMRHCKAHDEVHNYTSEEEAAKPIVCPYDSCDFRTNDSNTMYKHIMRLHCMNRYIQCDLCPARFVERCELNKHFERHHADDHPVDVVHNCSYCDRSYKFRQSMLSHQSKKHPEEAKRDGVYIDETGSVRYEK